MSCLHPSNISLTHIARITFMGDALPLPRLRSLNYGLAKESAHLFYATSVKEAK